MTQSTDELEAFLQEHAGTYLQGVATYDADGLHWQHTTEETPPTRFLLTNNNSSQDSRRPSSTQRVAPPSTSDHSCVRSGAILMA